MKNIRIEERLVLKKPIQRMLNKLLLSIILVLIGMIITKNNPDAKEIIKKNLYEKSLPFTKAKKIYTKYFGNMATIIESKENIQPVIQEKLYYKNQKNYYDGVELQVENGYSIPIIESGVIVYIGQQDKYGNSIIVEQTDGVETLYGNVKNSNYKLYDYIEKGKLIGEAEQNKLYLVFQKEGKILDYQKYL